MKVGYLGGVAALGIAIVTPYVSAEDSPAREITLVGCVMHETEYRDTYGPGRSGPRGPGIGGRDEYMLVDAQEVTPGSPITVDPAAPCPPVVRAGFPTSYELTGPQEKSVAGFVGRRVELTGIQKRAKVEPVGTSGIRRPTGGFDPLGHELHVFEVEIASVREPSPALAAAPPAPAPPAPAPIPETELAEAAPAVQAPPPVEAPAPQPQVAAPPARPYEEAPRQVAQAELPRTAGPLPFTWLIGLLSLVVAAGIRTFALHR
jgi:hypothetical protein